MGTELAKPKLFEINCETGEIRSNIFYCDTHMLSPKLHIENNHILYVTFLPRRKVSKT